MSVLNKKGDVVIVISGLDDLAENFRKAPKIVSTWINKAIQASVLEVEKEAVDENFQFKTPRAFRTGYLQRSFKLGITFGDFYGSIGPIAEYAEKVHNNNPFMPRIAAKAEPRIVEHFQGAADHIAEEVANI